MREVEVKLEQIQLDQESPEEIREENVVTGEEERLCPEEEQVQEQEEEERAEQEVRSEGADLLLSPGSGGRAVAGRCSLRTQLTVTVDTIGC